jgi:ADP-dependent NAD(P)H-hydrate dehydratase / NAD(P)H-hydrate epimerase
MKIFTKSQIRQLDQYTIEHEPIASIDLMERAAEALLDALLAFYPESDTGFCVFAGPGNNGGDALALARKLKHMRYAVQVHLYVTGNLSEDCDVNKNRLKDAYPDVLTEHVNVFVAPETNPDVVIIDGLFGSGLSRPLSGIYAEAVDFINACDNTVIAIDVPSGLNADGCRAMHEPTVKATYTFSLQFPKLAFFFPENDRFVGEWSVLDIGLHQDGIDQTHTDYHFLKHEDIAGLIKKRGKFTHKGSYGHLALLAGSKGMAGASILSAKAALRTGVGLLTVHGPEGNRCILQTITPEVIYEADKEQDCISQFYHADKYDAVAIGPGIGTQSLTVQMIQNLLPVLRVPCVFDADALNIIAAQKNLLRKIPQGSILTPHPKEFERLSDKTENAFEAMQKAHEMAVKYQLVIVLKGAFTKILTPDGQVYFNSTGNPGMATAGSGDVLTGMLGALLAQGYTSEQAAKMGVYLHGLAADLVLESESEESLMAGDIIAFIGRAFNWLKEA